MCEPRLPHMGGAQPVPESVEASRCGGGGSRKFSMTGHDQRRPAVVQESEFEVFGALAALAAGRDEQGLNELADDLENFIAARGSA